MKKIGIVVLLVLAILISIALYFWFSIGKPLYVPGALAENTNIQLPGQTEKKEFWQVESNVELYHFSFGEGEPILVLHGGPGFPFREHILKESSLNTKYQFIYYDQRGCGKSTKPFDIFESSNYYNNLKILEGTLGIAAQLKDIERIRNILQKEQLIIIGHSFGGFLASLYAAEFPNRVKSLILMAPADVLILPSKTDGLFEIIRNRLPQNLKEEYQIFYDEYFNFEDIFSKSESDLKRLNLKFATYYSLVSGENIDKKYLDETGGWITKALFFSMGKEHDYRKLLRNVTAPVLVLHGKNDLQPETASRLYADCFKNSNFKIIKTAGHFIFKDQPLEFEKNITNFLKQ